MLDFSNHFALLPSFESFYFDLPPSNRQSIYKAKAPPYIFLSSIISSARMYVTKRKICCYFHFTSTLIFKIICCFLLSTNTLSIQQVSMLHSSAVVCELLQSCYTGMLQFSAKEIVNYLTAASYLQMEHVVEKCRGALSQYMQPRSRSPIVSIPTSNTCQTCSDVTIMLHCGLWSCLKCTNEVD